MFNLNLHNNCGTQIHNQHPLLTEELIDIYTSFSMVLQLITMASGTDYFTEGLPNI